MVKLLLKKPHKYTAIVPSEKPNGGNPGTSKRKLWIPDFINYPDNLILGEMSGPVLLCMDIHLIQKINCKDLISLTTLCPITSPWLK